MMSLHSQEQSDVLHLYGLVLPAHLHQSNSSSASSLEIATVASNAEQNDNNDFSFLHTSDRLCYTVLCLIWLLFMDLFLVFYTCLGFFLLLEFSTNENDDKQVHDCFSYVRPWMTMSTIFHGILVLMAYLYHFAHPVRHDSSTTLYKRWTIRFSMSLILFFTGITSIYFLWTLPLECRKASSSNDSVAEWYLMFGSFADFVFSIVEFMLLFYLFVVPSVSSRSVATNIPFLKNVHNSAISRDIDMFVPIAIATVALLILVVAIGIWVTPQTSGSVYAAMIGGVDIPSLLALVGSIITLVWCIRLQRGIVSTERALTQEYRKNGPGLKKYSDESKDKILSTLNAGDY